MFVKSIKNAKVLFKRFNITLNSKVEMSGSVFTQRFNPVHGKSEWELHDENYDYCQEVARSSYADMLHDKERNAKYYAAIRTAVRSLQQKGKQVRVLDIGTGTGLLSMMAASCGADVITACEGFEPMAQCAVKVIAENGFKDRIKVVPKRSTELTLGPGCDMEEKANLLVTEVFDTELIGEGAILTYSDALKRLVEEDCIAVPMNATVYVQVIESRLVRRWNDIPTISQGTSIQISSPFPPSECSGPTAVHDMQLSQLPEEYFVAITKPIPVFWFDFTGKEPLKKHCVSTVKTTSLADGCCEAVFMWWELQMDIKDQITLSCAPRWAHPEPANMQWRDHWMQAIYYLPNPIKVPSEESLNIVAQHDEFSMQFSIQRNSDICKNEMNLNTDPLSFCKCGVHFAISRSRLGMLNDTERTATYIAALSQVGVQGKCVVSISDCSLLPLIAAKLGARKVYTLEPDLLCRSVIASYVKHNDLSNVVSIIEKHAEEVTEKDIPENIDLLIGEPFFTTTLLPWDSLFFWYARSGLSDLLAPSTLIIPQRATLRAVGVQFEDLWKIRAPVKNAEGFNLSEFDKLIQEATLVSDQDVEPHPLWEYPCLALTKPFDILCFDLTQIIDSNPHVLVGCEPVQSWGTCNGVALWIDYHLTENHTITTGPTEIIIPGEKVNWYMNSKQGVYLFDNAVVEESKPGSVLQFRVIFKPSNGTFSFSFELQPSQEQP